MCKKPLTIGVAHRIEDLATRSEEKLKLYKKQLGDFPIAATYSETFPNRSPYIMMVPLAEIIAESFGVQSLSKKVFEVYEQLVAALGGEFSVLFKSSIANIAHHSSERIAQGVDKVRRGDIVIEPGFDGQFGVVKIWKEEEGAAKTSTGEESKDQLSLF